MGLDLVLTPPALGIWPSRCPLEALVCEAVSCLQLVEPRGKLLVGLSYFDPGFGLLLGRYLLFLVPIGCAPVQPQASAHYSASENSRLRWRAISGGMRLRPYLSEYRNHSTPWESAWPTRRLSRFPQFRSGWVSIMISASLRRCSTMCFLAATAGLGWSEVIPQLAA